MSASIVDLNALHRELHKVVINARVPAVDRSQAVLRNLGALEPADAATLATHLVYNLTDKQLTALGRAALNALRRAAEHDDAERGETAVDRIVLALRAFPPLNAMESDGLWILSQVALPKPVTRAAAGLADAPVGAVVILVSPGELKTGKARLCEHWRQCQDELPEACSNALEHEQVSLLPLERVGIRTKSFWSRVRALLLRAPAWA